jgi:hypothetical protein
MTLWFVTPAFRRYELSAVCFDQRVRVIETLAQHGIAARCVVVAEDENLDLARERGFDVVERDNEWLGRRFNDGIEYAGRHGASRIIPIGSDSWIDPAYFLPLPTRQFTMTASSYAVVAVDRMGELQVDDTKGVGPYVFPRHVFRRSAFRPAKDEITHGVDASTVKGIGIRLRWQRHDVHPLQYVGFRGVPFISSYDGLLAKWGVREHFDPWAKLAEHYPLDLVERARTVLENQPAQAAA